MKPILKKVAGLLSLSVTLGVLSSLGANELKEEFFSLHSPRKMHEMRLKIIESEDLNLYLDFFEFDAASFTEAVLSSAPEQMKLKYIRGILVKEKGWGEIVSALTPPDFVYIYPPVKSYLSDLFPDEEFARLQFETPKRRAVLWKRVSELAGIKIEELPDAFFQKESE